MTEKKVPEYKKKLVSDLKNLITGNKTVLVASIRNLPAALYQEIVKKVRGSAVVKFPKKSLIYRAIDETGIEELQPLKEKIDESFAILFSDQESFDLASDLLQTKKAAKAKTGQKAPMDIEVPAGPTDLIPGPAVSELGALGIKIQIKEGKIEIKDPKIIVKEGETISAGAADVMSKLDIKPFFIGFVPLSAFETDTKKFYGEMAIDKEEAVMNLKSAFGKTLPFAVAIGYTSPDTIPYLLSKANSHALALEKLSPAEEAKEAPAEEVKEETQTPEETSEEAPAEPSKEEAPAEAAPKSPEGEEK